jgi:hypothetical protein
MGDAGHAPSFKYILAFAVQPRKQEVCEGCGLMCRSHRVSTTWCVESGAIQKALRRIAEEKGGKPNSEVCIFS